MLCSEQGQRYLKHFPAHQGCTHAQFLAAKPPQEHPTSLHGPTPRRHPLCSHPGVPKKQPHFRLDLDHKQHSMKGLFPIHFSFGEVEATYWSLLGHCLPVADGVGISEHSGCCETRITERRVPTASSWRTLSFLHHTILMATACLLQ